MSKVLVDSCVLIDVIERDSVWFSWSYEKLKACIDSKKAVINHLIYAEIAKSFSSQEQLSTFLNELGIEVIGLSNDVAYLAAQAHLTYRRNKGERIGTLPDFFIGAQAQIQKFELLTRDTKRFSTYFSEVELIAP